MNFLTVPDSKDRFCSISNHLRAGKLELIHGISDLLDRNGLWTGIASLGITREFIQLREDFYCRIIMELDFIEKKYLSLCPISKN
jgi:hypothetical protein